MKLCNKKTDFHIYICVCVCVCVSKEFEKNTASILLFFFILDRDSLKNIFKKAKYTSKTELRNF